MINRSSSPSLLRSRGGTTRRTKSNSSDSLVKSFERKSGSLTHGSLTKEPSLRALKAPKKDIEYGLPHDAKKRSITKSNDSIATNAKLVKNRRDPDRFSDPLEFGPNNDKSSPKRDRLKTGGRASQDNWIQDAVKKPGSLRKTLHVKAGERIPESKLKKAEHSRNPTTRKRAVLAETLKGFRHK